MDEVARQYNGFEAGLWTLFALGFAVESVRSKAAIRQWARMLSCAFLAFGFSDLVEMRTGAWWDPPWLLVLKLACGCVFILVGYRYRKAKRPGLTP